MEKVISRKSVSAKINLLKVRNTELLKINILQPPGEQIMLKFKSFALRNFLPKISLIFIWFRCWFQFTNS